jgi:hypothetical protein
MELISSILSGSQWVWITIAVVGALAIAQRMLS